MKKYLIVLAAAVVALASCKPGEESGSKYTKISFKESTLELAVGETARLKVLYEPTTLEAPVCEWTSSDPAIVTVDQNGNIEAIAIGEANITAKNGDLTAVCQVIVKTVYALYSIEDYGLFFSSEEGPEYIEGTDSIFNLSWAGGSYNCSLAYWTIIAWDGDITYASGFQGSGFLLYANVPFYTINDTKAGEYNGTPFGWGSFKFKDTKGQLINQIGEAGKINQAVWSEYIDSYIQGLIAEDGSLIKFDLFDKAVSGPMIFYADYSGESAEWDIDYGLISAVVKDMELNWDSETETFSYVADIDWFNNTEEDRFYGVKYDEEGVVKPYDLSIISEHYELDYAEMAPASEPKRITKVYKDMPAIRRNGNKMANNKVFMHK